MNRHIFSLFVLSLSLFFRLPGQEDEIILTIGDREITRGEFERIYQKNNSSAVYDNKSVEEYLELFINFKLKVIEAENMGYDTVKSFINELAGYREQLAKPYFEDKEYSERLLKEAYDRTLQEVNASHILIRLDQDASPSDTVKAYQKIMDIRKRILKGESFSGVAKATSDDPSAKINGGHLGWFSAFQMIYPFENIAYNTEIGKISMPLRTRYGYHIIRVNDKRESLGKVRIAHILVYAGKDEPEARKEGEKKINECYEKLKNGADFADLAAEYSDDRNTASAGGDLKWIRSGIIPDPLEMEIFSLKDSGDYTKPLAADYGFHIFMLLGKQPLETFEELKPELERKLSRDTRIRQNEELMTERIKNENNFRQYSGNLQPVIDILDESVYDGTWDTSLANDLINPVISFGDREYTQKEFARFISEKKKYNKGYTFDELVNARLEDFIKEKAMEYEKGMLEVKHPEFKNLMEEYHDGILLFNLTDDMVWSKAVKDTAGLKAFYENNKNDYLWGERISLSTYTFEDENLLKKVTSVARKRSKKPFSASKAQILICGSDTIKCVQIEDKKFEKDDDSLNKEVLWKKGYSLKQEKNDKITIIQVNDILPPEPKKLNEAKGLITADYQTYLEKEWIRSLRDKYEIEVHQEVLDKLAQ
ncbi:MAG: peptidylprolyl isomerase [Bacteroidales bacterium]|nr:peptidylprolyl isomerase [Bacteroidales bacterium]